MTGQKKTGTKKKTRKSHKSGTSKGRKAAKAPKSPLSGPAKKPRTPPPEVIQAAQTTERETGVPTSATLGQWALESGWGKHSPGNNPFGIKARPGEPYLELWTHEKKGSKLVKVKQKFRKFDSLDDAFRARGNLLSKHYPISMAHKDDPNAFVDGLQADPHHRYANTTGDYAGDVKGMMRRNNFYQYDLKNAHKTSTEPEKESSGGGVEIKKGEPSVMVGPGQNMAAHVESPHTGGGKIVEGSPTVFVGKKQLPFAREGDATDDQLNVKHDVQPNVLLDGGG